MTETEPSDPRRGQLTRSAGSLFSSDVYESYTATYTWASNQTAHLGLGFLAGAIALALLPFLGDHRWILFVPYPLKEAYDVYLARRLKGSPFPVSWGEILLDSATDLAFVTLGVALAALLPLAPMQVVGWVVVASIVAFLAYRRFMPQKRSFDKSDLPYLFRLGAYRADWAAAEPLVRAFMSGGRVRHLLLHGDHGSGRTTLAVGIACEIACRTGFVRYLSASRLAEASAAAAAPSRLGEPWTVREADWLAIDDVATFDGIVRDPADLSGKRVVWVATVSADARELERRLGQAFGAETVARIDVNAMRYQPPGSGTMGPASGSRRLGRIALWVANGIVAVLLVATAALILAERYWASAAFRDPAAAFHQGTIGTEFVPLPALQALPAIFPELFPAAGPAGDWLDLYGFVRGGPEGLPYGMTLSNYRPLNAAPSPVPFVGIGCATCHVGEVRRPDGTAVRVSGMGNASLDLLAFFEAFRHAILQRVDGQPTLTLARIREAAPQPLGPLDSLVVWLWLDTARKALQDGTARHDLPRTFVSEGIAHSGRDAVEILRDSRYYPVGPGRTNPFNTLVTQTLRLPNTSTDTAQPNRGYARIPPVWAQRLRKWGQFDGGINDLHARSALAALTIGATVENLAHPEIAHNIKAASDYVRDLAPPDFGAIFGAQQDASAVARGREHFRRHCSGCHGMPAADGGWPLPGDGRLILPAEAIGTDPERVLIRHAFDLAERLHAMFALDYPRRYNARHPLAVAREAIRPLTPDDKLGYIAQPIPGAALRAPLLHNGSVPSLAALLGLEQRPAQFHLGRNVYDPAIAGLRTGARDAKTYFLFDTSKRGNSAEGHRFPASREGRDPAAMADLLAYLKTL